MKTVQDVYTEYNIMPNLQLHQLRVAAVGKMISDNFSGEIDAHAVVLACLFHDMGNIIKFDLTVFPEFREPQGLPYWEEVKKQWIAKYGPDEHKASKDIAEEIGLPEIVCTLIDETRFSRLDAARDGSAFENKILKYADLRVGPFGVLSMSDRLEEGRIRYSSRKSYNTPEGRERYERGVAAAQTIETQIFEHCSIKPEDLNDHSLASLVEELRNYPVA